MELATYIDHTLLKPTATINDIRKLCKEAIKYQFCAVCVNACYITLVKKELGNSNIKIAAVIGFPLGATVTDAKIYEAVECIESGADEIDMVINIGWLKSAEHELVEAEIRRIKEIIGSLCNRSHLTTSSTGDETSLSCTCLEPIIDRSSGIYAGICGRRRCHWVILGRGRIRTDV